MQNFREQTAKIAKISLSDRQVEQFQLYLDMLTDASQKFNLTAIKDRDGILTKHFLDSLSCAPFINQLPKSKMIDVGTGAGFPGIPLKIVIPELHLTLVESIGKKARFCQNVVDALKLDHVDVLADRAEEIAHKPQHREVYDWVLARAVATLPVLVEYLLPLTKIGGKVLAQKGITAHQEAQTAQKGITILGGELVKLSQVELPGIADERFIIEIKKTHATPLEYPRRAGMPVKHPLG